MIGLAAGQRFQLFISPGQMVLAHDGLHSLRQQLPGIFQVCCQHRAVDFQLAQAAPHALQRQVAMTDRHAKIAQRRRGR